MGMAGGSWRFCLLLEGAVAFHLKKKKIDLSECENVIPKEESIRK
jgi:hypothetical protein